MTLPILLFAAGKGTRMAPLTNDRPKPLIPVAGKPLLDHALDLAKAADCAPRVINLHYKAQMIRDHLVARDVLFSDESTALLETGGGLRQALGLLDGNPVMTLNTDAVWRGPNPLTTLLNAWDDRMEALLLLVDPGNVHGHTGAGDFEVDAEGRLHRAARAVYTGAQIIRTDGLHDIVEDAFSMNLLWDRIARRGGLYGVTYPGQWCDVGQPASIPIAEAMLNV